MSHTPGPWTVSNAGIWAVSPWNAKVLIGTVVVSGPMNGIDAQANAQMFAAAPDMLAALKAMVLNDTHTYRDCHKAALAAIAKAEGL